MDNQVPVIAALLDRWLNDGNAPGRAPSGLGEVLDRLIIATQVRYPVIGNVARNVRFRFFDEPQIRKAREQSTTVSVAASSTSPSVPTPPTTRNASRPWSPPPRSR